MKNSKQIVALIKNACNIYLIYLSKKYSITRLLGQFRTSLVFYEKVLNPQKAPKSKTNNLHPLRSFCARKKLLPLLFSVYLILFC